MRLESSLPALIGNVALLEELLATHAAEIGSDFEGYRGHCYRVLNFCVALTPAPESVEKLAIATAFHDIGIWTHGTFDYLEPSVHGADAYLTRCGQAHWSEEVGQAIRTHHRIRSTESTTLIESFRRADWIDVTGGLLAFGLPRRFIREAFSAWPSAGFHRKLVRLSWDRFKAHPLSPLPMLKF